MNLNTWKKKCQGVLEPGHELISNLFCRFPKFTTLGLQSKDLLKPSYLTTFPDEEAVVELILFLNPVNGEHGILFLECNGDDRRLMAAIALQKKVIFSCSGSNVFSISFRDYGEICTSQALVEEELNRFHRVFVDLISSIVNNPNQEPWICRCGHS